MKMIGMQVSLALLVILNTPFVVAQNTSEENIILNQYSSVFDGRNVQENLVIPKKTAVKQMDWHPSKNALPMPVGKAAHLAINWGRKKANKKMKKGTWEDVRVTSIQIRAIDQWNNSNNNKWIYLIDVSPYKGNRYAYTGQTGMWQVAVTFDGKLFQPVTVKQR